LRYSKIRITGIRIIILIIPGIPYIIRGSALLTVVTGAELLVFAIGDTDGRTIYLLLEIQPSLQFFVKPIKSKTFSPEEPMSFLANLEWRRAEKGFAPPSAMYPVPDIQPILNAVVNAPSSFGIQPYVVKVVTCEDVKKALTPACYGQPQVEQCTHLLVF
jgi:hypothetical protein